VVSTYILTDKLPEIARPFSPERFAPGGSDAGDPRVAHPAGAVGAR
jgi:hypothetical protein